MDFLYTTLSLLRKWCYCVLQRYCTFWEMRGRQRERRRYIRPDAALRLVLLLSERGREGRKCEEERQTARDACRRQLWRVRADRRSPRARVRPRRSRLHREQPLHAVQLPAGDGGAIERRARGAEVSRHAVPAASDAFAALSEVGRIHLRGRSASDQGVARQRPVEVYHAEMHVVYCCLCSLHLYT